MKQTSSLLEIISTLSSVSLLAISITGCSRGETPVSSDDFSDRQQVAIRDLLSCVITKAPMLDDGITDAGYIGSVAVTACSKYVVAYQYVMREKFRSAISLNSHVSNIKSDVAKSGAEQVLLYRSGSSNSSVVLSSDISSKRDWKDMTDDEVDASTKLAGEVYRCARDISSSADDGTSDPLSIGRVSAGMCRTELQSLKSYLYDHKFKQSVVDHASQTAVDGAVQTGAETVLMTRKLSRGQ